MPPAGPLSKNKHIFMAWLDANDDHPYPTDQQLEEWEDEYGVTEHQLRTWFNKERSARKANKAKLNKLLKSTTSATNNSSSAVASSMSSTTEFTALVNEIYNIQQASASAKQSVSKFQNDNPGDQKDDWSAAQRTEMAKLHKLVKTTHNMEMTAITKAFTTLQSLAADKNCKDLCDIAVGAVQALFAMKQSREALPTESTEALPYESSNAFVCKVNVFKNADKSQLTYWKSEYYQAVLVSLVENVTGIFKYVNVSSESSQSFMKVFTSDLSTQEELVISAKERHANHKRDRFDQQYFVGDLTKDQLECDADELMAGMFVMEFSKDDGMKMTAINKSLG